MRDRNAALDEEVQDADRAAALDALADETLVALDDDRAQEEEAVEASIARQLTDLERETGR